MWKSKKAGFRVSKFALRQREKKHFKSGQNFHPPGSK